MTVCAVLSARSGHDFMMTLKFFVCIYKILKPRPVDYKMSIRRVEKAAAVLSLKFHQHNLTGQI